MEVLRKVDCSKIKELIPKHVTSGNIIPYSLGRIANSHWIMDISFHRQDNPKQSTFYLPEHFQNTVTRIKLRCRSLEGKLFAVGSIQIIFSIMPSCFEVCLCNRQFHHMFEGEVSTECTIECTTKNIDSVLNYVKTGDYTRNALYLTGDITFYSLHEDDLSSETTPERLPDDYVNKLRYESLNQLSLELMSMLNEGIHADVNLVCGTQSIGAHKAILSARSPVFAAMFQNPMKETIENEIDFKDMDCFIFRALVEYLYSGDVSGINSSLACELLSVAETYQLSGLKKICVDIISGELTIDNVLRTLVFADLYDESLKKKAISVICKNYDILKTTPEWKALESERTALIFEIMDCKIQSLKVN